MPAIPEILSVDPRKLRVSPQRLQGADPIKLHRQIARHGKSTIGMPLIEVYRGLDGELIIFDGVTRATRVAKLLPGTNVDVQVNGTLRARGTLYPTIEETLP